ncbi:MAG: GGDEF domain-containing protein [Clostridia bacterium]|nr:GGDEF domain-containing protein [Clostridia bacterium]
MFEEKNCKGLEPKYYHKMIWIIVLTSILLSVLVALISGPRIAEKLLAWHMNLANSNDDVYLSVNLIEKAIIYIFIGMILFSVLLNTIVLTLVKFLVLEPMISDLQKEKRSFRKDNLTGLCRREVLEERTSWYEQDYESIAILYVDVNNLKNINDDYGHDAGDEAIIGVANEIKKLRTFYSELDHFRVGGDEFVVIIKDATEERARDLGRILSNQIERIMLRTVNGQKVTAAIGFAYANNRIRINSLMHQADDDMYRNKKRMKGIN